MINETLRRLRLSQNKTQKQVADDLDIFIGSYSHYETGRRKPSLQNLLKFSSYYNVPIETLIDDCSQPVFEIKNGELHYTPPEDKLQKHLYKAGISTEMLNNLSPEKMKAILAVIKSYFDDTSDK